MGKGSGTGSRSSVKMWGSGTSLSHFELENAGLRNELDPFWAWKCLSPERPRTHGARAQPAVGGDERVQIKEILKMMVSGTAKSAKKFKWWCSGTDSLVICENYMLRNGFFGNLWKLYAPERKFRAENWGLSRGTYPISVARGGGGQLPPNNAFRSFVGTFGNLSVHVSRQACHLYRQSIWSTNKILKEIAVLERKNAKIS